MSENSLSSKDFIVVPCFEAHQRIGTLYVAVMDHADVLSIAEADVRRLEQRDIEEYSGIQRDLNPDRVKQIKKYANLVDATFPSAVILHISSDNVSYDKKNRMMTIRREKSVAKILDGQHRLKGLEGYDREFDINVAIFIDLDLEDQANVFATINLAQTKVNKSLVYDLFEYSKVRSPAKTAHLLCRSLNKEDGSPFKDRIKVLGYADDEMKETLTQALFVEQLLKYLTKDFREDRNQSKQGKPFDPYSDADRIKFFLRKYFCDGKDEIIGAILWNYFGAAAERWPHSWHSVEPNQVLLRSTGFTALMRFLKPAYASFGGKQVPSQAEFLDLFRKVQIEDGAFTKENFIPGGSGQSVLLQKLNEILVKPEI